MDYNDNGVNNLLWGLMWLIAVVAAVCIFGG